MINLSEFIKILKTVVKLYILIECLKINSQVVFRLLFLEYIHLINNLYCNKNDF